MLSCLKTTEIGLAFSLRRAKSKKIKINQKFRKQIKKQNHGLAISVDARTPERDRLCFLISLHMVENSILYPVYDSNFSYQYYLVLVLC
jgi:hypothetical protein